MRWKNQSMILIQLAFLICLSSDFIQGSVIYKLLSQRKSNKFRQDSVCLNQVVGDFASHPEDCRLFFYCNEAGQAILAECPPTMLFNANIKLCDNAANVNCRVGTTLDVPTTDLTTMNPPSQTTTAVGGVNEFTEAMRYCASLPEQQEINRITFIASSSSCQRYYICYYGQALLQECSANLHWNSNIAKCDLPSNANCRLQEEVSDIVVNTGNNNSNAGNNGAPSGNPNNGNINQLINCPNYGQHIFPHMGRCDFFIYCVKGHATLQQCPFYYYFDIVTKSCKWRTVAVCVRDLNINF